MTRRKRAPRTRRLSTGGLGHDPGAQPQRTVLAWQRTVLACGAGALVLAFTAQRHGYFLLAALAGLTGAGVVLTLLLRLGSWRPGHAGDVLHLVACCVTVVAVLAVVVAVRGLVG